MASLSFDKNGNGAVYVLMPEGGRRPVRLGKMGRQRAEGIRGHITELEQARLRGYEPASLTRAWLMEVKGKLRERLAGVGLCEPEQGVVTVGAFIDQYLAERHDLKTGTLQVMKQARRHLAAFLGEDKPMSAVRPADADAFQAHLRGRTVGSGGDERKLARATCNKWLRYARHYFDVAKRRKLIQDNPFGHISGAVRGNAARRVFVPAEDVLRVIDAAADAQWKLLIALGRFGGLRVPSEVLALTWRDVDFERGRFIVRSSKTEHHEDGGVRVVPMFPELEPLFQAVYDDAPEGTEHVITRYRDPSANLRTQLVRYITAAGLTPWPKPWQNLRASRATELADTFPSHVCAAWLGHTEKVADEYYRSVTDEHFTRAVSMEAVRKAVRATGAGGRTESRKPAGNRIEPHENEGFTKKVGEAGFEPAKA